jgi:hypothetical protein
MRRDQMFSSACGAGGVTANGQTDLIRIRNRNTSTEPGSSGGVPGRGPGWCQSGTYIDVLLYQLSGGGYAPPRVPR